MKNLLLNDDNVIVYISDICEVVVNGFYVGNNLVFNPAGLRVEQVETVPEGVEVQKHCYTQIEGFYENPNYIDPNVVDETVDVVNEATGSVDTNSTVQ